MPRTHRQRPITYRDHQRRVWSVSEVARFKVVSPSIDGPNVALVIRFETEGEERFARWIAGEGWPLARRARGPQPWGVLLSRDQMVTALGAAGLPLAWADHWPNGAILWRAAHDKKGYESIAPLSTAARTALDAYLARYPMAGDLPLIPGRGKPDQAINKEIAGYWLTRAEKLAKLPKLARGGFHPFRRLWASERRHLPAQDVAAAGGWRSLEVMRHAYQHADAAGVMNAVELRTAPEAEPDRHTIGTPQKQNAG